MSEVEKSTLLQSVENYVKHLQDNYNSQPYNSGLEFVYEVGRKYVHVIMRHGHLSGYQRSSHSWVMLADDKKFKVGDILKSASWKAPARNFSRGNVLCGGYNHIRWSGV
jgi:hypothetical protein